MMGAEAMPSLEDGLFAALVATGVTAAAAAILSLAFRKSLLNPIFWPAESNPIAR